MVPEIDVVSFKKRLDARSKGEDKFFVLDVRNPNEQQIALIPGTDKLIPVSDLATRIEEIRDQANTEILVYCRSVEDPLWHVIFSQVSDLNLSKT